MQARAARYFGAAKKALGELREYYTREAMDKRKIDEASPTFPFPTQYRCLHGEAGVGTLTYLSHYGENARPPKLLFLAKTGDGEEVLVKFVRRYSLEAHQWCMNAGFAPELKGFQVIGDRWCMVVMEYLKDHVTLDKGEWKPERYKKDIREKLSSLHRAGFVHGDIRDANILVRCESEVAGSEKVWFIDFDWSGRIGEVCYPANLNQEIRRHEDAQDGKMIRPEHDMAMVDYM